MTQTLATTQDRESLVELDGHYHTGWTFHRAGSNISTQSRKVMTVIYIEDGIRLIAPNSKARHTDWDR